MIDVDDILCALDAFAGDFNPPDCTLQSTDIMSCDLRGDIDVDDLLGVLDAFASVEYGCSDPCNLDGPMGGGGGGDSIDAVIDTVASQTEIKPERTVIVRAFVTSDVDLRAFQVAVEVSGGTGGSLELEDVSIEDTRTDYLFYSMSEIPVTDVDQARAAGALFSGDAAATTAKYLVSFTYRASNDAEGTFTISSRPVDTLLRDENSAPVGWEAGDIAEIIVE